MSASDWIALAALIAAVGTAIVGVIIGIVDRRNARQIAEEDRRASSRQARLMFEWEAAQRLAINLARGGHTDPVISKDMGAEALALTALLGPDRVPHMWAERVGKSDDEMQAFVDDQSKERWLRHAAEAERAMNQIAQEIRDEA